MKEQLHLCSSSRGGQGQSKLCLVPVPRPALAENDNPGGVTAPAEGTERCERRQTPRAGLLVAASLGHAREPAQLEEGRCHRVLVVGDQLPEQGARPCHLVLSGQHSSCSLALWEHKSDCDCHSSPGAPSIPSATRAASWNRSTNGSSQAVSLQGW